MISLGAVLCVIGLLGAAFCYWAPPEASDSVISVLFLIQRQTGVLFGVGVAIVGAVLTSAGEILRQVKKFQVPVKPERDRADTRQNLADLEEKKVWLPTGRTIILTVLIVGFVVAIGFAIAWKNGR